ncbi:hypothetical protein AB5I41_14475 [Sphingomonas sp. MMS24-JH45]
MLTQRNLTSMVTNVNLATEVNRTLIAQGFGTTADTLRGLMPRSSTLLVFPLFHISGLHLLPRDGERRPADETVRRWDPEKVLPIIAANKVTMLSRR